MPPATGPKDQCSERCCGCCDTGHLHSEVQRGAVQGRYSSTLRLIVQ